MTINIIQTVTNLLNENRQLIRSTESEAYILTPAEGKALKNIKTGRIYTGTVNIGTKGKMKDFVEIDIEE